VSAQTNESSEPNSDEKATTVGEFAEEILPHDGEWHDFSIGGSRFQAKYYGSFPLD
jgi:hypothetical protein